jgi:predicted ATPase
VHVHLTYAYTQDTTRAGVVVETSCVSSTARCVLASHFDQIAIMDTSMPQQPAIFQSQAISQGAAIENRDYHLPKESKLQTSPLDYGSAGRDRETPKANSLPPPSFLCAQHELDGHSNQVSETPNIKRLDWAFLKDGQLFGRERETELLDDALHRRLKPDAKPELILISGSSGTGKTVLSKKLRKPVEEKDGFFIMGKFDQLQRPEPYAPLVAAMTTFVMLVLERGEAVVENTKLAILEAFGDHIGVLTDMIPALVEVVGKQSPCILKGSEAQDRLKTIFCKFVRVSCSIQRPLVLVMDDLQWADVGSLELLEGIISDPLSHGLAVVGICRSNEVPVSHEFSIILRRLEDERETFITNVEVGNLSLEATTLLVSKVLCSSSEKSTFVSHTLHAKTDGNVFFIVELLKVIYEDGVLVPDESNNEWLWDNNVWARTLQDSNDVVDLVVQRIEKLPAVCRILLSTAACLGAELDECLLFKFMDEAFNLHEAIYRCSSEGILMKDTNSEHYRFCHDRIQQASYYLIAEEERPLFHLSLGRQLVQTLTDFELTGYIFVVVDQLLRGVDYIEDETEKVEVATLCVQAGHRAVLSSDFKTALRCFQLGETLLDARRKWIDYYDMTLDIFNAKAEAFCCLADFDGMERTVDSIFANATCFDDKLRGYMLRIYSLGCLLRLQDAIQLGLGVLERLGEKFPKNRGDILLVGSLLNVKRMLWKKTDAGILRLPDISDGHKLSAMGILNMVVTYSYLGEPDLFPFIALRMVKISLKYGLSAVSCMGFAVFGLLLAALGDIDGGYRFGQLSLSLLERYKTVRNEWLPRVFTIAHGLLAQLKEPIRPTFEYLLQANRVGLESGDVEYAWIAHQLYSTHRFLVGEPIVPLEFVYRDSITCMKECNQETFAEITLLSLEATLIMMGREDDPVVVNGTLMNLGEPDKLREAHHSANLNFQEYVCEACCLYLMISYHLGDLDVALMMAKKSQKASVLIPASPLGPFQAFYDGLAALTVVRQNNNKASSSFFRRRRLLGRGRKCLKILREYSKHCRENNYHRVLLLEAEFAVLGGDPELAIFKYATAEELAGREGFLDVQGLACERAGLTLRQFGRDAKEVTRYLKRSLDVYTKWGAAAKVDRIKSMMDA